MIESERLLPYLFLALLIYSIDFVEACWCCPKEPVAPARPHVAGTRRASVARIPEDEKRGAERRGVEALVERHVTGTGFVDAVDPKDAPRAYQWSKASKTAYEELITMLHSCAENPRIVCKLHPADEDLSKVLAPATNLGDCGGFLEGRSGPQSLYLLGKVRLERAHVSSSPVLQYNFFESGLIDVFEACKHYYPEALVLICAVVRFLPENSLSLADGTIYGKEAALRLLESTREKVEVHCVAKS